MLSYLLKNGRKSISYLPSCSKYTRPELPYSENALEPYMSAELVHYHYGMHHQAYVNNLNNAVEKYEQAKEKNDLNELATIANNIKFNAGGHSNHSLFWKILSPKGAASPIGILQKLIVNQFGSLDNLVNKLSQVTVAIQGSGWGWLTYNKDTKTLQILTTQNQDMPPPSNLQLLNIDVWEHAYHLQYKSDRAGFVKNLFNIVSWKHAEDVLSKCA